MNTMTATLRYACVVVVIFVGFGSMGVVGICEDDVIRCDCGSSAKMTTIVIRRCPDRHGRCEPCDGLPYTRDSLCLQFRYCSTCSATRDGGCLTCPPGIRGKTCLFATEQACGEPPALSNGFVQGSNWAEGSRVTYFCERDWMLTGDSELVCVNAQWSGETPVCLRTCGPPPRLENGTISGATNWTEGGLAIYHCDTGGGGNERPQLVCRGGQWQGETPECENTCPQPPSVQNGRYQGTDWSDGRRVTYSCNIGWDLSGDTELICRNGQWSGRTPTCGKPCAQPPSLDNGYYEGNDWSEGGLVVYYCNFGWKLTGDEELRCKNGRWAGIRPSCEKTCSIPLLSNARVDPVRGQHNLNTQITVACYPGFTIDGSSSVTLICLATGRWDRQLSGCTTITTPASISTCPLPQRPLNGGLVLRVGQTAFISGQKASFTCNAGYVLSSTPEVTCQDGGTWSTPFPQCTKVSGCSDPGVPDNGKRVVKLPSPLSSRVRLFRGPRIGVRSRISISKSTSPKPDIASGQYKALTKLEYSCDSALYTLNGSAERTCQGNGEWTGEQPACVPVCGRAADVKAQTIVNGRVTRIGDWPWLAFIAFPDFRGGYVGGCAGTLIGGNWVITAAHCVRGRSKDDMKVYLGKYHRDTRKDDSFVQEFQVSEIHISPVYNHIILDADVAILRLRGHVVITKRVSPICLSSLDTAGSRETEDLMKPGRTITVVGWGQTENGTAANIIRVARIQTISNAVCEQKYAQAGIPLRVTNNMFCAGQDSGRVDACYGDSGGPTMAVSGSGRNRKWTLVGIVSWGSPVDCGLAGQYGGYTRISKFFSFIKSITNL